MQHMGQKHGGQLLADSVGQRSCLDHQACFACGTSGRNGVAGATSAVAALLSVNFALRTPSTTDDSLGIGSRSATPSELAASASR